VNGYPIELKFDYIEKSLNVSIQTIIVIAWKRTPRNKDGLIHNTHEQYPEPFLAKLIKKLKPLAQQKKVLM